MAAYIKTVKYFFTHLWEKEKTRIQPHPNKEKIYSVDTFGFSQKKWAWVYIWDALTQQYQIKDALPLCPRCELPMLYAGNPFLEATCQHCDKSFPVYQFKFNVLEQIEERYPSGYTFDFSLLTSVAS
ncbi:MAG: hypothetical protein COW65_16385 [Cytophagales bacterium CG18_big_fil_WC_8_21_14_2_50_42_9]|nr:MAG: hypothetical protein COW65_16385 [Cytophagales bacterium CG18_big_fil_WC_8_21_14_2_50_42_9]